MFVVRKHSTVIIVILVTAWGICASLNSNHRNITSTANTPSANCIASSLKVAGDRNGLIDQSVASQHIDNRSFAKDLLISAFQSAAEINNGVDLEISARAMAEIHRASKVFEPYKGTKKLTIFGSARTPEEDPAFASAKSLASLVNGKGWMTISGGGGGIMRAGNAGAPTATFGLNITLPFEQKANPFVDPSRLLLFKYFFARKLFLVKEADGVASYPGGFGTQDEAWEVITLMQTGKSKMIPFVFVESNDKPYWRPILKVMEDQMLRDGYISPNDTALYKIVDSPEEASEHIEQFYKNYESLERSANQTVIHIKTALSSSALNRLNQDFKGILKSGTFEQVPVGSKQDIKFQFNNRDYGTLRKVIDFINGPPS